MRMNEKEVEKTEINAKKKNKKRMIIAIIIVVILAAISYVITLYPDMFEKKTASGPTSMYSDKLYSYNFYPSDYDLDVTTVPEYMELDRGIHYKNGNYTILVLDEELSDYNDAVKFFHEYFKTLTLGDTETYNSYFTDEYYESNEPYYDFAPQMIYNIEVEQLSETFNDDGTTTWTFNVMYMIYRNDGTFRNDMGSDAAKKLYYELIMDKDGEVKINYITYYKVM